MNLLEIRDLDKKYYMNTFGERKAVAFERGEGIYLYGSDGKRYVDFFAGIAVNILGHSHSGFTDAICNQAKKLLHTSNLYYSENQAKLAQKICDNSCADKVFFANSGAEANEGALKLARIYHYKALNRSETSSKMQGEPRNKFVTLENSFHGRTLATVAATGQPKYQKPYKPLLQEFVHVPANDMAALENAIDDKTAGVIFEVVQGESGVHPLKIEYLARARELCDRFGALLIFDEVQTGMGRTGALFAYQQSGIEPDIFTLAKALGGGVPISAVCAKDKFAAFEPGEHGTTFGGNPFACRAGLAVFEAIEKENLVKNSRVMGDFLQEKLREIGIKEVRGCGLMIAADIEDAPSIVQKLFEKGYLVGCVGNTLRILPPLIVNKDQIQSFVEVLAKVYFDRN